MSATKETDRLEESLTLDSAEKAREFYDRWAGDYDDALEAAGYAAPRRVAQALARFARDKTAPVADFGCGTGLGGAALRQAGFPVVDGFDISPRMLAEAERKGVYRRLVQVDLAAPLQLERNAYANAVAIGVFNAACMAPTVVDEIIGMLPAGGCLAFSLNDRTAADGAFMGRVMDLTDTCTADVLLAEAGEHIPGAGLNATVYVIRKR